MSDFMGKIEFPLSCGDVFPFPLSSPSLHVRLDWVGRSFEWRGGSFHRFHPLRDVCWQRRWLFNYRYNLCSVIVNVPGQRGKGRGIESNTEIIAWSHVQTQIIGNFCWPHGQGALGMPKRFCHWQIKCMIIKDPLLLPFVWLYFQTQHLALSRYDSFLLNLFCISGNTGHKATWCYSKSVLGL